MTKKRSDEATAAPSRPSKQGRTRDSRTEILKAAVTEFADRGLAGARIEQIALRSGFNKALVYRYFTDKRTLFTAALRFKLEKRFSVAANAPDDPGDLLVYWFKHTTDDPPFLRMIQREALQWQAEARDSESSPGALPPPEDPELVELRARYFREQVAEVDARKARGQVDPALPSRAVMLLVVALFSFPAFFPNLVRDVTGLSPTSPEFREEWSAVLRELARRIFPPRGSAPGSESPPPA